MSFESLSHLVHALAHSDAKGQYKKITGSLSSIYCQKLRKDAA